MSEILIGIGIIMVSIIALGAIGFGANLWIRRIKRGIAVAPAKNKSKVMRNAKVQVHKIEPAEEPTIVLDQRAVKKALENSKSKHIEVEFDEETTKPKRKKDRKYYAIEFTIEPPPAKGKFREWNLDDLQLIPFDTKLEEGKQMRTDVCSIEKCEVLEGGAYVEPDSHHFEGTQRMNMIIGVKPGNPRLKFNYMFESFGDLPLAG